MIRVDTRWQVVRRGWHRVTTKQILPPQTRHGVSFFWPGPRLAVYPGIHNFRGEIVSQLINSMMGLRVCLETRIVMEALKFGLGTNNPWMQNDAISPSSPSFNGYIIYKWACPLVMLLYRRVPPLHFHTLATGGGPSRQQSIPPVVDFLAATGWGSADPALLNKIAGFVWVKQLK